MKAGVKGARFGALRFKANVWGSKFGGLRFTRTPRRPLMVPNSGYLGFYRGKLGGLSRVRCFRSMCCSDTVFTGQGDRKSGGFLELGASGVPYGLL